MATFAHVQDGVVRTVETIPDGMSPGDLFPPDMVENLVLCEGSVQPGQPYASGSFAPKPAPDLPTKVELIAHAAAKRYDLEVGGIVVAGVPVATDDRSKTMLLGARIAASSNDAFTTPWIGSDGSEHSLNAVQIVAISDAVLAHVNGCFVMFGAVRAGIEDGSITSIADVDAAFAS